VVIKVLIVDADPEARASVRRVLRRDEGIVLAGETGSLRQALALVQSAEPNVVLVRCAADGLDAAEVTSEIMTLEPKPVIAITDASDVDASDGAFRAMEAGAVAAVVCPTEEAHDPHAAEFLSTVRLMSEVRVVRRRRPREEDRVEAGSEQPRPAVRRQRIELIVIGASTGGPLALQALFGALPRPVPVPILVVQHITPDFQIGFTHWLGEATDLSIALARSGDEARPGRVFVAPHPHHMVIGADLRIALNDEPPEHGVRPAVSRLFRSAAGLDPRRTAAVLLTGMGKDGAAELGELRERGALTFAQDAQTSAVHGMPGEAIRLGAAAHVLPPDEIGAFLGRTLALSHPGEYTTMVQPRRGGG
jgi:two-component system, chemotaxis family, protein-glutamate methylesterase/glutaminase